jgi:SNF2 family DNA or RNA helicase
MFENPINNARQWDSTTHDKKLADKRLFILHNKLAAIVLRKDSSILREELPPKNEIVISVMMSPLQVQYYCKQQIHKVI